MLFLRSTLMSAVKLSDIATVLKIKLRGHFSTCYSAVPERYLQLVDTRMHAQIHTNTNVLTHINARAPGGSAAGWENLTGRLWGTLCTDGQGRYQYLVHNTLIFPHMANATRLLWIQPGACKPAEVPANGHH